MTDNVLVDGVRISDAVSRIRVDGTQIDTLTVDGTLAYDIPVIAPNISTSASLGGTIQSNVAITNWTPTNTGGTPTSYSIVAGALPTGLSLNTTTGVISGTPTSADGTYNWTVRATNATGSGDFADSVNVLSVPNITTSTDLDAANDNDGDITNGAAITAWNPTSTGGAIASYAIVAGSLPTGLSLNTTTGAITGTPTVDGTFNWTVRATNAVGTSDFADTIDVVTVAVAAPNITTSTSLDALNDNDGDIDNGTAITNWTPTNTGGAPTSYSISAGALPPGLTLNTTTGVISGTPTTNGAYNWTVTATNGGGSSNFADSITVVAVVLGTIAATPGSGIRAVSGGANNAIATFNPGGTFSFDNADGDFLFPDIGGNWHNMDGTPTAWMMQLAIPVGGGAAVWASGTVFNTWLNLDVAVSWILSTTNPLGGPDAYTFYFRPQADGTGTAPGAGPNDVAWTLNFQSS